MWSAIPVALLCMIVSQNERQSSGPEGRFQVWEGLGGTNKLTNERTNERKSPCVLQDFVPFRAAAQKG